MKFLNYESKPVTRQAFQITEEHTVKHSGSEATYVIRNYHLNNGEEYILFKAYEEPKVGDWIVRLTETDTYHCTDAVFKERNIVPE